MSENISDVRHRNARRILANHCDGVIRKFAEAIGKGEAQCSNLLRQKNPVKIGDKVAREIEFAFGYKSGWLDLPDEVLQESSNFIPIDLVKSFSSINKSLDDIAKISIEGMEFDESIYASHQLSLISERFYRLNRQVREDLNTGVKDMLTTILAEKYSMYVNEDIDIMSPSYFDLETEQAVFVISHIGRGYAPPRISNSNTLGGGSGILPKWAGETIGNRELFQVVPLLNDSKPVLLFILATPRETKVSEIQRFARILRQAKSVNVKDEPFNKFDFHINAHPRLNELAESNK